MAQDISPQVLKTQNKNFVLIVVVSIFALAIIFVLVFYFFTKNSSKTVLNDPDTFFVNLPKELLKRDATIPLTPNAGYLITTSFLSNKKDKTCLFPCGLAAG